MKQKRLRKKLKKIRKRSQNGSWRYNKRCKSSKQRQTRQFKKLCMHRINLILKSKLFLKLLKKTKLLFRTNLTPI